MRYLTLCLLLTACDEREGLIVPEDDTDVPVCDLSFRQETGECSAGGFGYWTPPARSVYSVFRCDKNEVCTQSGVTVINGEASFVCSEHSYPGDHYRVDYITP